jgi:hypothetical protein
MKLALTAIIIFALLGSLVAGLQAVEVAEANFVPGPPGIFIASPVNKTYNTQPIYLNLTIRTFFDQGTGARIVEYSLDGKENVTIPTAYEGYTDDFSAVTALVSLPELSEGSHSITVYATYHFPNYGNYTTKESTTSSFTINYASPYVSILTPKTQEYNMANVALTFTVDKPVLATSYKLDGKANVPIDGNTTLTGLSDGAHRIVIYATDALGTAGISETVLFFINTEHFQSPTPTNPLITPTPISSPNTTTPPSSSPTPTAPNPSPTSSPAQQPTPSPSPSAMVDVPSYDNSQLPYLVGISLIAIGVMGLLAYFKKRR